MEIVKADDVAEFVMDSVRLNWGHEAREHIHLSDLLAPRQAFWRRVQPLPPTNDEIMYWATGRGHEEALFRAADLAHGEPQVWNDIWYTPDTYHNFPAELKTRRRGLAKAGEEKDTYDHYLKQLKGYCAVTDRTQGWLHVWCLLAEQPDGTTKPELASYRVTFTPEELETERKRLLFQKEQLEYALSIPRGYEALEQCPQWMCGRVSRTMKIKPYCTQCKKDFATEYGAKRHVESKTGAGHEVSAPVYNYAFEKRCKYFDQCNPKLVHNEKYVEEEKPLDTKVDV